MVRTTSNAKHTTIKYEEFKGCDFSADATAISRYRSPDGLNMISDQGGNPIKRCGWEMVSTDTGASDYLFPLASGKILRVSHATIGTTQYIAIRLVDVTVPRDVYYLLLGGVSSFKLNNTFAVNGKAYVFANGYIYLCTTEGIWQMNETAPTQVKPDGTVLTPPEERIYTPTILVGKKPDGTDGTTNEAYNILSARATETFFGDGTSRNYVLANTVDTTKTTAVKVNGTATTDFTVSGSTVTFTTAPSSSTDVTNVEISYYRSGVTPKPFGTITQTLAEGASQRWWFAETDGNNKLYYSALGNPLYIPDNNYVAVGTNGVKIMGLLPVGNSLGVIKENNMNESTLWYVTATTITENTTVVVDTETSTTSEVKYVYKVENGVSDVGGIAPKTFRTLADEPLYLSSQGIVAITSKNTSSEKVVRKRSMYLDGKLLKEAALENAIACVWNGYYVLAINGHMYLLDSRQKTSDNRGNTSFNYEGYYWDNCSVKSMCVLDGVLYFSGDNGLCRFKTNSYTDDTKAVVEGEVVVTATPVDAVWSTCDDDDNLPQYRKTATKKGSYVVVAPYSVTGFTMSAIIDGGGLELAQTTGNILFTEVQDSDVYTWSGDFTDIDFTNFTFYVANGGVYVPFTKKIKKYRSLKLVFENDENQPFGLYKIVKTVEYSQYAR